MLREKRYVYANKVTAQHRSSSSFSSSLASPQSHTNTVAHTHSCQCSSHRFLKLHASLRASVLISILIEDGVEEENEEEEEDVNNGGGAVEEEEEEESKIVDSE
jgi:hypothetical protein